MLKYGFVFQSYKEIVPGRCGFFAFDGKFKVIITKKLCWSYIDTLVSGSPIIQNGKLVGAVTHVLVDDPTKGYGIFAENMLETAQRVAR